MSAVSFQVIFECGNEPTRMGQDNTDDTIGHVNVTFEQEDQKVDQKESNGMPKRICRFEKRLSSCQQQLDSAS